MDADTIYEKIRNYKTDEIEITDNSLKLLLTNEKLLDYVDHTKLLLHKFTDKHIYVTKELFIQFINTLIKRGNWKNDYIPYTLQILIDSKYNNIFEQKFFEQLFSIPLLLFFETKHDKTKKIYEKDERTIKVIDKFISNGCIFNIICLENMCSNRMILSNFLCLELSQKYNIKINMNCIHNILKISSIDWSKTQKEISDFIFNGIKSDLIGFDIFIKNSSLPIDPNIFITDEITFSFDTFKLLLKKSSKKLLELLIEKYQDKLLADYSYVLYAIENNEISIATKILKKYNIQPTNELYEILINNLEKNKIDTYHIEYIRVYQDLIKICVKQGVSVDNNHIQLIKQYINKPNNKKIKEYISLLMQFYEYLPHEFYTDEYFYDVCTYGNRQLYTLFTQYITPTEKCIDYVFDNKNKYELEEILENLIKKYKFNMSQTNFRKICRLSFYDIMDYLIETGTVLNNICVETIIRFNSAEYLIKLIKNNIIQFNENYFDIFTDRHGFYSAIEIIKCGYQLTTNQIDNIIHTDPGCVVDYIKAGCFKLNLDQLKFLESKIRKISEFRILIKNTI